MSTDAGRSRTAVDRKIPLVVTVTRQHVVWIDVDADDDSADVAALWIEEPYDLLTDLTDRNAEDFDWRVEFDPAHRLVQRGADFVGPTFASGAWSQAEEDRYQQYLRTTAAASTKYPCSHTSSRVDGVCSACDTYVGPASHHASDRTPGGAR